MKRMMIKFRLVLSIFLKKIRNTRAPRAQTRVKPVKNCIRRSQFILENIIVDFNLLSVCSDWLHRCASQISFQSISYLWCGVADTISLQSIRLFKVIRNV